MTLAPDRHAHDHDKDHAQGHAHGHAQGHAHLHEHGHARRAVGAAAARRAQPGLSLLRMSALQRLAVALAFVAAIWLGVAWAWS
jgi:ABC-type Zn2+ transport system substrate-binding protein/surface adhesin